MKKMMANKKYLAIMFSVAAFLVALAIAASCVAAFFSGVLDVYVGMGEEIVERVPGSENWDTEYYSLDGKSETEVSDFARSTTKSIAGEGMVLLKNNGALPLRTSKSGSADKKVTLLGRRSVDMVFGGTGSGSGDASQCTTLVDALTAAGYSVNDTVTKMYSDNLGAVPVAENTMDKPATMTYYIGEFPQSYYSSGITSTFANFNDAAIVVLGRQGGEGMDFAANMKDTLNGTSAMDSSVAEVANYADDQHQLELSKEEKDLISLAKSNFDTVIVLINSANVMEIDGLAEDEGIDSIIWMSYPGSRGNDALAEILNGTINPSGRTVDTWMADMTADPTFVNTYSVPFTNVDSSNALSTTYTVEYEEGIYVGYRYYETAAKEGFIDYDEAVTYPFGYGLSYGSFEQVIKEATVTENGQISVTVTVTNTQPEGGYAGKDVIQLYYHAPYGDECEGYTGTIEKAEVVLAAYDKTDVLQPQESKDYTLTFPVEEMASYDYKDAECYVLDAGDYTISLRRNSHELYGAEEDCTFVYTQEEKVVYDSSNPRRSEVEAQKGDAVNYSQEYKDALTVNAATNKFTEMNEHFVEYTQATAGKATNFTRADFGASYPTAPKGGDLVATESMIANFDAYTPDYYDNSEQAPTTGASNNVTASSLRGVPYDDPLWDELLDQLSAKDMAGLIYQGNQGTPAVSSINLPMTKASDGPAGLKQFGGIGVSTTGNFNCSATLVAATWNTDLAEQYGVAVGLESLQSNPVITGWYAPGANTHRSPFGGRNFEYYSEDPLISGKACAATVQGAGTKGVETYMKHFVINDLETHRTANGPCTWVNEQAFREIYLRAFEYAIKEPTVELKYLEYTYDADGNPTGAQSATKTIRSSVAIMSSFNRIGSVWAGGCSELLNDVLRGEWGFMGSVVTDFNGSNYMHVEEGVANGNDLMLSNESTLPTKFADINNASTIRIMRQALKNVIYSHVNSNAMNGRAAGEQISYATSPWVYGVIGLDALLFIGAGVCVFFAIRHTQKWKKYTAESFAAEEQGDADAPEEKKD